MPNENSERAKSAALTAVALAKEISAIFPPAQAAFGSVLIIIDELKASAILIVTAAITSLTSQHSTYQATSDNVETFNDLEKDVGGLAKVLEESLKQGGRNDLNDRVTAMARSVGDRSLANVQH